MLLWLSVAVVCLLALLLHIHNRSNSTDIPIVPGVPLLGNAVALGKGGLAFISQCRKRFGDVFCLHVFGQRMVFVFDPAMLTLFFKAPESSISFKPAVERFTQRIYGLPSSEFFSRHEDLLATLRQLLVPSQLDAMGRQLLQNAQPILQDWQQQQQVELWSGCQGLVFAAAGQVLFGRAFFKRHGLQAVLAAFLEFEGQFELAASPVPHLLLPSFRRSRRTLLTMLSTSLAEGDFQHTVVEQLMQGCGLPERLWPNLLLAVLWASQANSMPAMFWSLALLLLPQHADARARVLQELRDATQQIRHQQQQQQQQQQQPPNIPEDKHQQQQQQQPPDGLQQGQQEAVPALDEATVSAMLALALDKRSWVSCCVAEAIRLRLHSIAVRFVSDETLILQPSTASGSPSTASSSPSTASSNGPAGAPRSQLQPGPAHEQPSTAGTASCRHDSPAQPCQRRLHVPRGSILCICPMESHHDPRLYPNDPWAFKPDRQPIQGLGPGTVVPSAAGMGFGGGFWRCPGRFFAEMELALLLQLVLLHVNLQPFSSQYPHRQGQQVQGVNIATAAADNLQQQRPAHTTAVHAGKREQQAACTSTSCAASALPAGLRQRLKDMAVFGLGCGCGSSKEAQEWLASGIGMPGTAAVAEAAVQLPHCEMRRLVGFKVPSHPWQAAVGPAQV